MHLLVYSVLRILIILGCAGLLYLLGLRSWLLWITAILVGALVSYVTLRGQLAGVAGTLRQVDPLRSDRPKFSEKAEADAAYEDAVVDAAEEDVATGPPVSGGTGGPAGARSEGESQPQDQPVPQDEEPSGGQDGDEVPPGRT